MDSTIRIIAHVKGRVQGVGFRSFVVACARATRVTGFVRNMADRSVTIVAEGESESISRFLAMVNAPDDPYIQVETLETTREAATAEFAGFGIRW